MKKIFSYILVITTMTLCGYYTNAAAQERSDSINYLDGLNTSMAALIQRADSICTHKVIWSTDNKILPWYQPSVNGLAYAHVVKLASEFLRDVLPPDQATSLPQYYLYSAINGPENGAKTYHGRGSFNNPACVFAGLTEGLMKYSYYSGDESYLEIVRGCLDFMLENGTTPLSDDWNWAGCPYASADPGVPKFEGSSRDGKGGGDGHFFLEPDKVGEMGVAYLQFYQLTEEKVYLEAALNCANALVENVREGNYNQSPWPFRTHAKTGAISEEYCSNVLPAVRLFDEIARLEKRIQLGFEIQEKYKEVRQVVWKWLYHWDGPMRSYVWKGYFEDVEYDHKNRNRVQITPLEIARYLIQYPEFDGFYKENVTSLIHYCNASFGTQNAWGFNAQCEQYFCMTPMGSHTARYASVCAMWYAHCKNDWYKNEAMENFNWATYCTAQSGFVSVGPEWPSAWFSDGYADYIRHFMDGLAAVPEWVPAGENHLLESTSIVQKVKYGNKKINYRTFMPVSSEILKLTSMPKQVTVDDKIIKRDDQAINNEGWSWEGLRDGGVLRVKHQSGQNVEIILR